MRPQAAASEIEGVDSANDLEEPESGPFPSQASGGDGTSISALRDTEQRIHIHIYFKFFWKHTHTHDRIVGLPAG